MSVASSALRREETASGLQNLDVRQLVDGGDTLVAHSIQRNLPC